MLPWIVSFLSGRTNSIGKANACQTQIKLRNQVCVDSIKKTFYQIVCSEEKLFLCSCQTETYSNSKQYFSSSIAERSGKTGFYWPVLIRSFQFGGERTPNMQYRRKNQMSPDLFPSQDSTTLKSQKWFYILLFRYLPHNGHLNNFNFRSEIETIDTIFQSLVNNLCCSFGTLAKECDQSHSFDCLLSNFNELKLFGHFHAIRALLKLFQFDFYVWSRSFIQINRLKKHKNLRENLMQKSNLTKHEISKKNLQICLHTHAGDFDTRTTFLRQSVYSCK